MFWPGSSKVSKQDAAAALVEGTLGLLRAHGHIYAPIPKCALTCTRLEDSDTASRLHGHVHINQMHTCMHQA